ncbi:uncharacterized protein LOC129890651 [Solanum dulcamara]|uniref:uncharacterized protein LOC129890651 n=1 Tax=Solanum dulcamara TaxID=45834 RepID=UPI0024863DB3|nr:uncharacterized protein LOC129890651 [Solanum dulcamara]
MVARTVRDVAVPLIANVTSSIQKPPAGGRFELKQNMVQLFHSNSQFTGLPHEDHQVHIQNFLEISDIYTPIEVSPDYVRKPGMEWRKCPSNCAKARSNAKYDDNAFQHFSKRTTTSIDRNSSAITYMVQINLPLIDVLKGIPKYAKFVKDIVANKSKLAEFATVALTEECSSRILNKSKLLAKLKDPVSFTVQVTFGKYSNARGLYDLGASINLIPRSMLKNLDLVELKATTILLQLVDRSVDRPDDFEPDFDVPFILGRPFLATEGELIDVAAGRLTMRAHDKVEVFDVYYALKLPGIYEKLSAITIIDDEVLSQFTVANDLLGKVVMG